MLNAFSAILLTLVSVQSFASDPLYETSLRISQEAKKGQAYSNLKDLVKIGPRLAGTHQAVAAAEWVENKMKSYTLSKIEKQPVRVSHWDRGKVEKAWLVGESTELKVTSLGHSVATGPEGLEAEVVEVSSLEELAQLKVQGKIVFFNRPMPILSDPLEAYQITVNQRSIGPTAASKQGAVGVLVRSVTPLKDDDHPHTGITSYRDGVKKIPAAAISTHGANILSARLKANPGQKVKFVLSGEMKEPTLAYNVIGEIPGSELPEETIVLGAHLDSWDLGVGAHDDGAGVVHVLEVMRVYKALKIRPKRTIQAVLFMSEETDGSGYEEYLKQVEKSKRKIRLALESDLGGESPRGFSYYESPQASKIFAKISEKWMKYLKPVGAASFTPGGGGVDVDPLADKFGAIAVGFQPSLEHYFDYHHSSLDQLNVVQPAALSAGAAAIGVLVYLASETMPE